MILATLLHISLYSALIQNPEGGGDVCLSIIYRQMIRVSDNLVSFEQTRCSQGCSINSLLIKSLIKSVILFLQIFIIS